MADKRAYFKLDVGYMSNPKVLTVLDESPTAVLLHVASIGYAAQHLTDGVVPVKALLRMTGATQEDAALLFDAGLWIDGPSAGKAEVHDYLQHQRSAAEVKGASEKAKRAASARWDASSNASGMPDAMLPASESAMPREEREEREETSSSEVADATPDKQRDDVERLCQHLANSIEDRGAKKPTITKAWRTSARLLLDKDGYTEQQVVWLIDRSAADDFWSANILSMPKLREKADQLKLKFRNNVHPLPQRPDDQGRTLLPPLPPRTPWEGA